jgi:cell wall-associated NlpC family hydrolase
VKAGVMAAAFLCGAFVLGLAVIAGGATGQDTSSAALLTVAGLSAQTCKISGPVGNLDAEQGTNADLVVSAAMSATDENTQAAQIAVMAAITESGLRDLDHGDRDSLGLFQQRPSQGWGTPAQIMNPVYATDAFVQHLVAVPGWQAMPPWLAAQAVQRSAHPDGSNYQANWAAAGSVVAVVLANGDQPGACGQGSGGLAGLTSSHGLPAGYAIPAGTPPEHRAVVAYALAQLGKPYVWGAAGAAAFDCSGLTMAAWGSAGVPLLHYTGDQQHEGVPVTAATLIPGDLVLTPGSDPPAPGVAGHVGLFIGNGLVVSAVDPQLGVAVQSWSTFVSGGLIALRDPAPDA